MIYNNKSPFHTIPHHAKNGLVHCMIEIPYGSMYKYEYNEAYGVFETHRRLPCWIDAPSTQMQFPVAYGYIPRTLAEDGDCLDIVLVGAEGIERGTLVEAKILGNLKVIDKGQLDHKLIAVPNTYPDFESLNSIEDADPILKEIWEFFEQYKNNTVPLIKPLVGPYQTQAEAQVILDASIAGYEEWVYTMQVYSTSF